jgi:putative ABC transport system substrate-binding protein
MDRRAFLTTTFGAAATPALAQVAGVGRPARIGILTVRAPGVESAMTQALLQGLRDHGYVEGRNVVLEYPDAEGRLDRLSELAAQLVRKGVDLILVIGPSPLDPARKSTKSIPIVMVASSADPVREGVAASLARPGGNVTGLTYAEPDRFKKQLELLKSLAPRVARVSVLWDFEIDIYRRDWEEPLSEAARVLSMTVQEPVRVSSAEELPRAFDTMKRRQVDAFIVASGAFLLPARKQVADLALQARLPAIAAFKEFPQAGLLMSYGPDLADINRRAGGYVSRILKGARPGDLPIELPSKFDLAINLRTAKALRLAVDQPLQLRATELYH